jgi:hypothetical protein
MSTIDLSDGDVVGAVLELQNSEFWLLVGFLALFGLVSFFGAFRYLRRARVLEDVPTSKIRSASQGYVEFEGHAMPAPSRGQQVSPLSGKPCLWWDYKVEQQARRRGRHESGGWKTIESGTSKVAFLIDDETGQVLVKPAGAITNVCLSRSWYGAAARPAPTLNGIMGGMSLGSYRYTERMIIAGEKLYALGRYQTEYENGIQEHTLSDSNDGRPFLISTKSQERLTAGLKSSAGSSFAAFLASGAGLMWLLAARGLF